MKDSEFQEALPLNGREIISIIQDGHNRKVGIKDFVEQLFNIGVEDFLNITSSYNSPNISLKEAIKLIPDKSRKEGQVITFLNTEGKWEIYQFTGKLNQWNNTTLWSDPFDLGKFVVKTILPDEEDITKSEPDINGNSYLSLKDRKYEPDKYSGLGRKILRKRIVEIEDPIYGIQEKNLLLQADFAEHSTVYEIRYDFDLNGVNIFIPENCVISYKGGSITNGTITYSNTIIEGNEILKNVETDGICTYLSGGEYKDSKYNPDNFSGLGKKYIKRNITNGRNILTQEVFDSPNTIYEIKYDFELDDNINIPENCTLFFNGGKFIFNNSTLTLQNTTIEAAPYQIFDMGKVLNQGDLYLCNGELSSKIIGTSTNSHIYAGWFGVVADSKTDSTDAFQAAINVSNELRIPIVLPVSKSKRILLSDTIFLPAYVYIDSVSSDLTLSSKPSYGSILTTAKYMFRRQKEGAMTEQERLVAEVKATIKNVAFRGTYSSPWDAEHSGPQPHNNDPFWIRKTYVFYGITFTESIIDNIIVSWFGTFIYGIVKQCSKIINSTISVHRTFLTAQGDTKTDNKFIREQKVTQQWNNSCREFGYSTSYNYKGINYTGYEEPIEGYSSTKNALVDSSISKNYLNSGKERVILFYDCRAAYSHISDNYIDFAYMIYYCKGSSQGVTFLNNQIDYCYIILSGIISRISLINNHIADTYSLSISPEVSDKSKMYMFDWDELDTNVLAPCVCTIGEDIQKTNKKACILNPTLNLGISGLLITGNSIIDTESMLGCAQSVFYSSYEIKIRNNIKITTRDGYSSCSDLKSLVFKRKDTSDVNPIHCTNIDIEDWDYWEYNAADEFTKRSQNPTIDGINRLNQNKNSIFYLKSLNMSFILSGDKYIGITPGTSDVLYTDTPFNVYLPINACGIVVAKNIGDSFFCINEDGTTKIYNINGGTQGYYRQTHNLFTTPSDKTKGQLQTTGTKYPYFCDGTKYIEYDSATKAVQRRGLFSDKPDASDIYIGFQYFCADKQTAEGTTDGIIIYHKGSNVWVDALGRVIS